MPEGYCPVTDVDVWFELNTALGIFDRVADMGVQALA